MKRRALESQTFDYVKSSRVSRQVKQARDMPSRNSQFLSNWLWSDTLYMSYTTCPHMLLPLETVINPVRPLIISWNTSRRPYSASLNHTWNVSLTLSGNGALPVLLLLGCVIWFVVADKWPIQKVAQQWWLYCNVLAERAIESWEVCH
jgi:hypothetical protein